MDNAIMSTIKVYPDPTQPLTVWCEDNHGNKASITLPGQQSGPASNPGEVPGSTTAGTAQPEPPRKKTYTFGALETPIYNSVEQALEDISTLVKLATQVPDIGPAINIRLAIKSLNICTVTPLTSKLNCPINLIICDARNDE